MFHACSRRRSLIGSVFCSAIFSVTFSSLAFGNGFISIDGDSFKYDGQEYRLLGLDAPEYSQKCTLPSGKAIACGKRAKVFLESVIGAGSLSCDSRARDVYSRILATCAVNGEDIGALIVRSGHAIATSKRYRAFERAAKAEKREIWRTVFLKPAKWRRSAPHARFLNGESGALGSEFSTPMITPAQFFPPDPAVRKRRRRRRARLRTFMEWCANRPVACDRRYAQQFCSDFPRFCRRR